MRNSDSDQWWCRFLYLRDGAKRAWPGSAQSYDIEMHTNTSKRKSLPRNMAIFDGPVEHKVLVVKTADKPFPIETCLTGTQKAI